MSSKLRQVKGALLAPEPFVSAREKAGVSVNAGAGCAEKRERRYGLARSKSYVHKVV